MYDFQNFSFWFFNASLGSYSPSNRSQVFESFFCSRSWTRSIFIYKRWIFLDLETEAEIYEKLGYYLWSPGGNGQNARYQASFDFGTNLTCDTKINDIKVLLIYFHFKLLRTTYDFTSKYFIVLQIFCYFSIF